MAFGVEFPPHLEPCEFLPAFFPSLPGYNTIQDGRQIVNILGPLNKLPAFYLKTPIVRSWWQVLVEAAPAGRCPERPSWSNLRGTCVFSETLRIVSLCMYMPVVQGDPVPDSWVLHGCETTPQWLSLLPVLRAQCSSQSLEIFPGAGEACPWAGPTAGN